MQTPKWYLDWKAGQAEKAKQERLALIKSLGGYSFEELELARELSFEDGVAAGSGQTQVEADAYILTLIEAIQAVVQINGYNPKTLLAKVRGHMREARRLQRQKEKTIARKQRELAKLQLASNQAGQVAADVDGVLSLLKDVNLTSDNDFKLPKSNK